MAKRNPAKDVSRLLSMLLGLAYCGGLAWYFMPYASFTKDNRDTTSTVIGLSIIGILIGFGLIVFLVRAIAGYRGGGDDGATKGADLEEDGAVRSDFDADEIIARYMAQGRALASANSEPAPQSYAPPMHGAPAASPVTRQGFGRKPV